MLMLMLACSTPAPVQATAEVAPTEQPTTAPEAASTASESTGHCSADEQVYFTCKVADNKQLSLCGSGDLKATDAFIQYRYGPIGTPEMRFPDASADSVSQFTYEERHHIRSTGDTVQFTNDGYAYTVMSMTGSSHEGEAEMNNFVGVMVEHSGKVMATITCEDSGTDQLAALAGS